MVGEEAGRLRRMEIARTIDELRLHTRAWRDLGYVLALVPTMGALHAGHLALVEAARQRADVVIASIFVNPAQFGENEDFARYPRDEAGDLEKLRAADIDLAFLPSVEEMYPAGFATSVRVAGPARAGLEDAHRPGHFDGMATVVAKLFIQSGCHIALFGEKDWQQLQVVRRMTHDLDLPVRVVSVPTVREDDGLALSSRNAYLSPEERARAPLLHRALREAARAMRAGTPPEEACAAAEESLRRAGFEVDYVQARQSDSLAPLPRPLPQRMPVRLLAAARLGNTRLIDNVPLHEDED